MEKEKNILNLKALESNIEEKQNDGASEILRGVYPEQSRGAQNDGYVQNRGKNKFKKIGQICLYLLVALTPIFFLPFTIAPVEINKQIFAGVLALAGLISYLIFSLHERKIIYPKSRLSLAVAVLLIVWTISAIFSNVKIASFWGNFIQPDSLVSLLIYCLVFFLVAVFFRKENLRFLGIAFFSGLALTTIAGLLGILWPRLLGAGFNTVGTLLNSAIFGSFGLAMVIAILFSGNEAKKKDKIFLSVLGLLIIFQLILLNYSFIWLILIAAVLMLAAYEFINTAKLNASLIILAGGFLFLALMGPFFSSFVQLPLEIRPSLSSTWTIAKESSSSKRLFLGNGPATFEYSYALHRPLELNQTDIWPIRFHQGFSFLATVLATTGILGILAILFLIFSFIWQLRKTPISLPIFIIAAGTGFLLAAWLFAPLSFTQALFIFMGMGLIMALTDSVKEKSFTYFSKPLTFAVFILCIVLVMGSFSSFFVLGKKYAGAVYYSKGLSSINSQNNLDRAISQLDKARQLDSDSDQYFRALSQALFAKVNKLINENASALSTESGKTEIQNTISAAVGIAERATIINDKDSLNWSNLGNIYEGLIPIAADAPNLAEEKYLKAMTLDPKNPQEPVNLARSLVSSADIYGANDANLKQEKLDKAKSYLEKSINLKADYAPAHFLAAVISLREGKTNEAIQKLELAKRSAPSDIGLAFQLGLLYYQNNQFSKAQAELERAVSANPNYANARYFLGLVYDHFGNKKAALEQFEKVAALNPDNEEVKQIINNLNEGRAVLEEIVPPAEEPAERLKTPVSEKKQP